MNINKWFKRAMFGYQENVKQLAKDLAKDSDEWHGPVGDVYTSTFSPLEERQYA